MKMQTLADPRLYLSLEVSSEHVAPDLDIIFRLGIKNRSHFVLTDVVAKSSSLSPYLEFIPGSVTLDNSVNKDANINDGVEIHFLKPGDIRYITYATKVLSGDKGLFRSKSSFSTDILVKYKHGDKCVSGPFEESTSTDLLNLQLYNKEIELEKSCDSTSAKLNDVVKYKVELNNSSDLDIYDVLIEDNNLGGLSLINGTFTIDGVTIENVNLNFGINIGPVRCGKNVTIEYEARVISDRNVRTMENTSTASYNYTLPNGLVGRNSVVSNKVNLDIADEHTKNILIENFICLTPKFPNIDKINSVTGVAEVTNYFPLNSIRATSNSSIITPGRKLLIKGFVIYTINYKHVPKPDKFDFGNSSINFESPELPFETTMIIYNDYDTHKSFDITAELRNIYYENTDPRCCYCTSDILLTAR
ncbi:MAG: DUF11 domain-containing protein [Clostridioides sp.]|nr:DUF11 domain-containing protein [Clostridioides sp.]